MRVCFLVDFRGKLTRENYYTAGAVVEFEPAIAQALIDEGWAVAFTEPTPPTITPALPRPRKRQAGGGVL